jgi:hypothetical protein
VASASSLVHRSACLSAGASRSFPSRDWPGIALETCHRRTVPAGAVAGGRGVPTRDTVSVAVTLKLENQPPANGPTLRPTRPGRVSCFCSLTTRAGFPMSPT